MYSTVPVPIPQREKGLSIKKIGNVRYVYYNAAYKYSAQTKKTSPQSKSIGKVIEDRPGMMYPNENFSQYFPEEAAEHPNSEDTPKEPATEAKESSGRQLWEVKVGGGIVLDAVLKRLKLKPLIRRILGKRTELFLDLLACCVLTEGRLDWNRYREEHTLFQKGTRVPSASEAAQFLRDIPEEDCSAFLDAWNQQRDHSQSLDHTERAMDWYTCRDSGAPPFQLDSLFPAGSVFPHGGMLLSFAAQIVWNEMFTLLQPSKKEAGLQFPGLSPVSAGIAALENMKIVRNEAYQYRLASALKKAQKDAFAACGIAPDVAVQRAWEIGLQFQTAAVQASSADDRRS